MRHHLLRMHEAVLRSAPIRPGDRILYLGADSAALTALVADRLAEGGELVGLDFSFATLQRAERVLASAERKNMLFMRLEGPHVPFPDGYFDLAIAFGTPEKRADVERALPELARVLRVDGRIFWHDAGAGWDGLRERLAAFLIGSRRGPALATMAALRAKLGAHFELEFARRWTHAWGKTSCLLVGKKAA